MIPLTIRRSDMDRKRRYRIKKSLKIPGGLVKLTNWNTNKAMFLDRTTIIRIERLNAVHVEPTPGCECPDCQQQYAVEAGERTAVHLYNDEVILVHEQPRQVLGIRRVRERPTKCLEQL